MYLKLAYLTGNTGIQGNYTVGLEQRGPEKYFKVFFYYGQKNIFVDLHV
jgi:hypothetical protein